MNLPSFPVDPQTLDLLERAVRPGDDAERSSLGDFCALMTHLGGSPDGPDDPAYHYNDVIGALIDEVRRLLAWQVWLFSNRSPLHARYQSLLPDGSVWCESSDPNDYAPGRPGNNRSGLTFQILRQWTVREPWAPWTPPARWVR